MKKILVLLMVLFVLPMAMFAEGQQDAASDPVALAAAEYFADYPGSRIIPTTKVFEALDAEADVLILDIRRAEDYAAGHIKGAVNAPWGPELAKAMDWLPDDMPIYVGCYSGQTAGQATAVLNIAGFNASSIKYGWKRGVVKTEGYEAYVETTANAAPEASGVRIDAAIKTAAQDYFNNLKADPKAGSHIVSAAKVSTDFPEATIVSIRKAEDYAKGHIEGAINIPFGENMQASFDQLPKDNKVLVYCYSGQTAGQTVAVMRLMGYDAASINSGMGTGATGDAGWGNEGLPVVK